MHRGAGALRRALLIAALLAIGELVLGLWPGHLLVRQRAEPDSFLAFRPWLLLLLPMMTGRVKIPGLSLRLSPLAGRLVVLLLFIGMAGMAEWLLLSMIGVPDVIVLARAAGASLLMGMALIGLFALLKWLLAGRKNMAAAAFAICGLGVLALRPPLPSPMHWYEHAIRPPPTPFAGRKPVVAVISALPLFWGQAGPAATLAGDDGGFAIFRTLASAARIVPVHVIDDAALRGTDVLMLAQPRALAPAELVRIDRWVRDGGRLLVLADPLLHWSGRQQGRGVAPAPVHHLLSPLLDHWGVEISPAYDGMRLLQAGQGLSMGFGAARLGVADSGVIHVTPGGRCASGDNGLVALCAIGRGRAMIVADADWLADAAWVGPGPDGTGRNARIADNSLFLIGIIRHLAGHDVRFDSSHLIHWMG